MGMRVSTGAQLGFRAMLKALQPCAQAAGRNPYPHKFHVSLSLPEYVKKFGALEAAEQLKDSTVSVAGALTGATLLGTHFMLN